MRISDWSSDVCSSDLEGNRDGLDENYGENNGTEGATDDPRIEAMRLRQIKNLLATLLLSRGVPMLLGGDEFRRTQRGNNKIGRASCRERVCQYAEISVVAVALKKKKQIENKLI